MKSAVITIWPTPSLQRSAAEMTFECSRTDLARQRRLNNWHWQLLQAEVTMIAISPQCGWLLRAGFVSWSSALSIRSRWSRSCSCFTLAWCFVTRTSALSSQANERLREHSKKVKVLIHYIVMTRRWFRKREKDRRKVAAWFVNDESINT